MTMASTPRNTHNKIRIKFTSSSRGNQFSNGHKQILPTTTTEKVLPNANCSAAAAAFVAAAGDLNHLESLLDFFKRVRACGDDVYREFLDYMASYKRGRMSNSDIYTKVCKLFGGNEDVVMFFTYLVPAPYIRHISSREKREFDRQNRESNRETTPPIRRSKEIIISKDEETDRDMEKVLCNVDVKISNLKSSYDKAEQLLLQFSGENPPPLDAPLEKHFTRPNLAFIRSLSRKQLLVEHGDPVGAIGEVMRLLHKEEKALSNTRYEIIIKWKKIRQSRRRRQNLRLRENLRLKKRS